MRCPEFVTQDLPTLQFITRIQFLQAHNAFHNNLLRYFIACYCPELQTQGSRALSSCFLTGNPLPFCLPVQQFDRSTVYFAIGYNRKVL